jgi:hypothetical protein
MVGVVAAHLTLTSETSLSLYQGNFWLERYPSSAPALESPLAPEIVEERDLSPKGETFGYNRRGQMNRTNYKGILIDSYY